MDGTKLLAIIGVGLTLILGILTIWLGIRRKYPAKITFFKEGCIGLFDSIVRNLPELSVLYKNSPISENIVLLKGFFLNNGSKDITEDMVKGKLTIVLPQGYRWLQGKVVSSSPEVRASITPNDTDLVFDLGLFRCNEFIKFETLAELPSRQAENITNGSKSSPTERLLSSLKFAHRISDTQKVKKKSIPPTGKERDKTEWVIPIVLRVPLKINEIYYQHSTNLTTGMLWLSKTTQRGKR